MTTIIPPGYKSSPLGPIPSEWEVKELQEVATLVNGKAYKQEELLSIGKYRVLRVGNLFSNNDWYYSDLELEDNKYLNSGDLMYAWSASFGPRFWNEGKIIYHYHIWKVIPKHFVEKAYLYFLLDFDTLKILESKQGGTMFHVTKGDMEKRKMLLPPSEEQTAIANLLSTWDEAILKVSKLIEQHEERRKWLILELLSGERRLEGFDKKWRTVPLSECLGYNPREVPKPKNNFLALGIRSHGKGIFHKADFEPEDLAMDVLYVVRKDDLIVNITFAWEQAIAIAGEKDDGGLVSHRFPTYTFKRDTAIPEYFRYIITQEKFKYLLDLISPGGAGRNRVLSKKDFMKLEVTIPDVSEQQEIANILNKSDQEIQLLKSKLEKLREQKKGLMQQLLTGKKRLKF